MRLGRYSDKWTICPVRPVRGVFNDEVGRRARTFDTSLPELHKLHSHLGSGEHFQLFDAGRAGLLAFSGLNNTSREMGGENYCPPPSALCTDFSHPRVSVLLRSVEIAGVPYRPWLHHDCAVCPRLCQCSGSESARQELYSPFTCEVCLRISTHNRGLGYDNPRSRTVPRVRRVEFDHTGATLKFEASGSDLAAFEALAQDELGYTLRLHRAHQPDPRGGAPAASFTVWSQGFQLHNADVTPGASALFSTCIDPVTGAERYLGAPAGTTIAELADSAIEKGQIPDHRSSGWDTAPRGGGGGWGARAGAPVRPKHNLYDFIPSGCIDDGSLHHQSGFRDQLRRVWARRQQLDGLWSINSADSFQVPIPTDFTQIPSLNLALSRYGLRLSPFTHRLEISIRSSLDVAQRSRFGGLEGAFQAFVEFTPYPRGQPISAAIKLVEDALNGPLVAGQTRMELFAQALEDYLVASQHLYNQALWYEELLDVDRHFDSQPPDATLALIEHLAAEDFSFSSFQQVLARGRSPALFNDGDSSDESDAEADFAPRRVFGPYL